MCSKLGFRLYFENLDINLENKYFDRFLKRNMNKNKLNESNLDYKLNTCKINKQILISR